MRYVSIMFRYALPVLLLFTLAATPGQGQTTVKRYLRVIEPVSGTNFQFIKGDLWICRGNPKPGEALKDICEQPANILFDILKSPVCLNNEGELVFEGQRQDTGLWEIASTIQLRFSEFEGDHVRIYLKKNNELIQENVDTYLAPLRKSTYQNYRLSARCDVTDQSDSGNSLLLISPQSASIYFTVPIAQAVVTGPAQVGCTDPGGAVRFDIAVKAAPNANVLIVVANKDRSLVLQTRKVKTDATGEIKVALDVVTDGYQALSIFAFYDDEKLTAAEIEKYLNDPSRPEALNPGLETKIEPNCPTFKEGDTVQNCVEYPLDDYLNPPKNDIPRDGAIPPLSPKDAQDSQRWFPDLEQRQNNIRDLMLARCSMEKCTGRNEGNASPSNCPNIVYDCVKPTEAQVDECQSRYGAPTGMLGIPAYALQSHGIDIIETVYAQDVSRKQSVVVVFGKDPASIREAYERVVASQLFVLWYESVYKNNPAADSNSIAQFARSLKRNFDACSNEGFSNGAIPLANIQSGKSCTENGTEKFFNSTGANVIAFAQENLQNHREEVAEFANQVRTQTNGAISEASIWEAVISKNGPGKEKVLLCDGMPPAIVY